MEHDLVAALKEFIRITDSEEFTPNPIKDAFNNGDKNNVKKYGKKLCALYSHNPDVAIVPSLGQGTPSSVPALNFLAGENTTTRGIYPSLLYFRTLEGRDKQLILTYGTSETEKSPISWKVTGGAEPIKEHYSEAIKEGRYKKKSQISYLESLVYKVYYPPFDNQYEQISKDIDNLVKIYLETLKSTTCNESTEESIVVSNRDTFKMIEKFKVDLKSSKLIYSDKLIKRFVSSLETKPFVILSGLAGSGKTQLAIAFSKWITTYESQVCVVPVQSGWTNREPLLGYPDALNKGEYIVSNNVVKTIQEAEKEQNQNKPYFLILDEMNLSYVERYFADFLSSMESGEPIFLWDKPKESSSQVNSMISLPKNLFIIGTMNVDETTYMFSPKVLDRANVIEFKADTENIRTFLEAGSYVDRNSLTHKGKEYGESFVEEAKSKTPTKSQDDQVINDLVNFFKSLKKVNAEFGFRTASEINRYINFALKNGLSIEDAVDSAILQKLLPKLHGSRKKLTPVLTTLWNLCLMKEDYKEEYDLESRDEPLDLNNDSDIKINRKLEIFKYPLTAEKISRMFLAAKDNVFTSFAEA
ncbi:MAG: McrB family protein [Prevotella sp.]